MTELAGVPLPIGDARFRKHSLTTAAYVPLTPDGRLSAGLQLEGGLLMPTGGGAPRESRISDRFFLGGPVWRRLPLVLPSSQV